MENNILNEKFDGIVITNNCNYWIYVLSNKQWQHIVTNIDNGIMFISAYKEKKICEYDVILFYVKSENKTNSSGFIAIGQAKTNMNKNVDGLRIYDDNNMNRYIIELYSVSICNFPYKLSDFNDVITDPYTKIKTIGRFTITYLKGECVLNEINIKKLGFSIVKRFFELALPHINKSDLSDDSKSNVSSECDSNSNVSSDYDSNKSDDSNSSALSDYDSNKSDDSNSSALSDYDSDKSDESDLNASFEYNNFDTNAKNKSKIVNNIPILLISCENLKKTLDTLKKRADKINAILTHYMNCSVCNITNNNSRELATTLVRIKLKDIEYTDDDYSYTDLLEAYVGTQCYPNEVTHEYIKIYRISDICIYNGDVLIEYSSKIKIILADKRKKHK